jgi:hypothetical protein
VRLLIYSFLEMKDLMKLISKLSMKERESLIDTDILDQKRDLIIKNGVEFKNIEVLKYYI